MSRRLIEVAPAFVLNLYKAAFSYQEASEEATSFLPGNILSFRSTRRQDYGSALYQLGEAFDDFLRAAPREAMQALIAVVHSHVVFRENVSPDTPAETIDLDGTEGRIRQDYSSIWDQVPHTNDDIGRMLEAFTGYLRDLSGDAGDADQRTLVLETIITENELAALWRRVLSCAAEHPRTLGLQVKSLLTSPPILVGMDTTTAAGDLIAAVFPLLSEDEQRPIESTLLELPDLDMERHDVLEHVRDRLLGCIPAEQAKLEQTRHALERLSEAGEPPPNVPLVGPVTVWSRGYNEEEDLADAGVPVEEESNQRLWAAVKPAIEFTQAFLNVPIPTSDLGTGVGLLRDLREALNRANDETVHQLQVARAWAHFAELAERIARAETLTCSDQQVEIRDSVAGILIEAADHPDPEPDEERDQQFAKSQSWGGHVRIYAAEGILNLAAKENCALPEVVRTLRDLSADDVASVRFQISRGLQLLHRSPGLMWELVDSFAARENNAGVVVGLIGGPLESLWRSAPDRVAGLTISILVRARNDALGDSVETPLTHLLTALYIHENRSDCGAALQAMADAPDNYPDQVHALLVDLRPYVGYGAVDPPDPRANAIRRRALEMIERVVAASHQRLGTLQSENAGTAVSDWQPEAQEKARHLAQAIDTAASQLYFGSGAYDSQRHPGQAAPDIAAKRRFLREGQQLLDQLGDSGLAAVSHHVLETLEFLVEVDPVSVFRSIGRAVLSGEAGGYHLESLGVSLVVRLVERYVADYRWVFREHDDCRQTLLQILDLFVSAGWPEALVLSYRLEEIYR